MTMTFPRLLLEHARQRPSEHAMREKEYGIWQTWSWQRAADEVRWMAGGLASLGFQAGHNMAIVGNNRPHLYLSFLAVQSLRGIPVPMYQDAVASEMAFVLQDADIHWQNLLAHDEPELIATRWHQAASAKHTPE